MTNLNYLCFVDGLLEYASTSPSHFAHYQLVYAEEHKDADVQYLTLTDESILKMSGWKGGECIYHKDQRHKDITLQEALQNV